MQTEDSRQSIAIRANLADLRSRVDEAAGIAGRKPGEVEIVAVTKGHPASTVQASYDAGLRSFGENYVQEARAKQVEIGNLNGLRWHFIGHLQSNKAADVVGAFALIQSVDSERLAGKLGQIACRIGIVQDILIQVHLGDEETKFGVPPAEAPQLCDAVSQIRGLRLRGLMGIAPQAGDPQPHFARLRSLFEMLPPGSRQVLSMGMSADFEIALREGANMVRIGTALLGSRQRTPL